MTYHTDFICTYKMMDTPEDQEDLYRIQLLQAFGLEQWDDMLVNDMIDMLYAKLADTPELNQLLVKARLNIPITEFLSIVGLKNASDDILFKLFFKYEYFDLLHRCICDYYANKTIQPTILNQLLKEL